MLDTMTARLKGRRRRATAAVERLTDWLGPRADVLALALVGSYAYDRPRMASDVDLVLITTDKAKYADSLEWAEVLDRRPRLIRSAEWGPVTERRVRLRSGLIVELGITGPGWPAVPLDPGTARVLRDGCRVLHDPDALLATALRTL